MFALPQENRFLTTVISKSLATVSPQGNDRQFLRYSRAVGVTLPLDFVAKMKLVPGLPKENEQVEEA